MKTKVSFFEFVGILPNILKDIDVAAVITYNSVGCYEPREYKSQDKKVHVFSGGSANYEKVLADLLKNLDPSFPLDRLLVVLYRGSDNRGKVFIPGNVLREKGAKVAIVDCGCGDFQDFEQESLWFVQPCHCKGCNRGEFDLSLIMDIILSGIN